MNPDVKTAGSLRNKVTLVTGGASGIGRAIALAYAREGARVVVSDVDAEGGLATVSMIHARDAEALFVPAHVGRARCLRPRPSPTSLCCAGCPRFLRLGSCRGLLGLHGLLLRADANWGPGAGG